MKLSEDIILKLLRKKTERPMKFSELAKLFSIPDTQRKEFRSYMKRMVAEGSLVKLRGGRYGLPDEMSLVSGILQGHPDGYGFLVVEDKNDDIYIPTKKMGTAMHLDQVMVRIEGQKKGFSRQEGRVIRILERNTTTITGTFEPLGRNGWVIPLEPKYSDDVFVADNDKMGAKPRQVVCVDIIEYPAKNHPPVGKVTEIIGFSNDPDVELRSIFHKHDVRQVFPEKVARDVKKITGKISPQERELRRDLTNEMIFTIDGASAKDFDDAVSLDKNDKGYRLGVHIADVSHFVTENSSVFNEALERATSIYYPDGVIPMLPFELSNEICSLKPGVERLTLSIYINYDLKGKVTGHEVFTSIIKSQHRFTYDQVAGLLENGDTKGKFKEAFPVLQMMHDLSQTLRKLRVKGGSVNFNIPEPMVHLDSEGHVDRIAIAKHNIAHELIEEFMLAANQEVARHLAKKEIPSIHRIHEPPDEDKLDHFNEFIESFGLHLPKTQNLKPLALQKLLNKVEGKPEERVVNTLLLRSLKKAIYSETDPGHFCLGFEHYTHFTSPIRRFPDLITHASLKYFLKKKKCSLKDKKRLRPLVKDYAEQSTHMEIKAMKVEREVIDLRRAQFMQDKVGQIFSGIITSVTSFGLFVELTDILVEGLIHISNLRDDYYIFYEAEHMLKGQRLNRTFKIGDAVETRVSHVDIALRRIDLLMASDR
jgi:ribonuclease R